MLMLIEHDSILSKPEARQRLAAFVTRRPNIIVAVFHSATLSAAEIRETYPPELGERLMVTPNTPRDRDLQFWLSYEAGCVYAVLRHTGKLAKRKAWLCVVPPAWGDTARDQFGAKHVIEMAEPFSERDARRLSHSLPTHPARASRSLTPQLAH